MATRRLIAALLVMLFLTSLVGVLAPVERSGKVSSSTTSTSTTTSTTAAPDPTTGSLLTERISASESRPPRVSAEVGDQLQLEVASDRSGTVEIPGLGEAEDVDPVAPARFDVLLESENTFAVRFLGSDRIVAFIDVAPRRPSTSTPRD